MQVDPRLGQIHRVGIGQRLGPKRDPRLRHNGVMRLRAPVRAAHSRLGDPLPPTGEIRPGLDESPAVGNRIHQGLRDAPRRGPGHRRTRPRPVGLGPPHRREAHRTELGAPLPPARASPPVGPPDPGGRGRHGPAPDARHLAGPRVARAALPRLIPDPLAPVRPGSEENNSHCPRPYPKRILGRQMGGLTTSEPGRHPPRAIQNGCPPHPAWG